MRTTSQNRQAASVIDQKAIGGVDKYFANVSTLTLAGNAMTPAELKAVLKAEIDALKGVDDLRAALHTALVSARAISAKAQGARKALRAYILGNYGSDAAQMFADFGMNLPKTKSTVPTQAKADAAAKAKATRKARHTMGSKQKAAITGQPAVTTPKPTA